MKRNQWAVAKFVTFLFSVIFSTGAVANEFIMGESRSVFRLSTGILNGESGEYVYDAAGAYSGIAGYKISELQWELKDVTMIGLGFTFPLNERVKLNFDYWRNATDGDGSMDDYDWLLPGYDWTHWSHHDDTTVRDVSRLDINGAVTFLRFSGGKAAMSGLLGYRRDHLDWQSRGGYGIYSFNAYRDSYVIFPDIPVIAYEQTYSTPYFGLGVESLGHAGGVGILFNASMRYSPWARGEDEDIHYLRDLRFEEQGSDGKWLALDIGLEFEVDRQLSVMLGYNWQEYEEIKGSTIITDLVTGEKFYYPGDAAGLDHSSNMFNLGLNYRF